MKKTLLTLLGLIIALPSFAISFKYTHNGVPLTYTINSDGKTCSLAENKCYSTTSAPTRVTIPETVTYNSTQYKVTGIRRSAFKDCTSLTGISLPKTITTIEEGAFEGCEQVTRVEYPDLETLLNIDFKSQTSNPTCYTKAFLYIGEELTIDIDIPSNVTHIGNWTFTGAVITSINIPNTVESIGKGTFANCLYLRNIHLPSSIKSIGMAAFGGCGRLESINIPETVDAIAFQTFANCINLLDIHIPNSVVSIGTYAFGYCTGLTSITIPESVTSIDFGAFEGCSGLTSVTLGESLTSIEGSAFKNCTGLTSITIPESVTSIGSAAFDGCNSLEILRFNATDCNSCGSSYTSAFPDSLDTVIFGNRVKRITDRMFYNCKGLKHVLLGDSITYIGKYAFYECHSLTDIVVPNQVIGIGTYAFLNCSALTNIKLGKSISYIENWAFCGCTNLQKTEFESIESLCNIEFNGMDTNPLEYSHHLYIDGTEVENLIIPPTVTRIKPKAFIGCSSLKSVYIPNTVTSIGYSVFSECTGLLKAEFASIEAFCNITFEEKEANPLLYAHHLYINGSEVKKVSIPTSIKTVGCSQFAGCSELTSINIPESVTSIGSYAFYSCTGLSAITIPESVTSISDNAFGNCALSPLRINGSDVSMNEAAFSSLQSGSKVVCRHSMLNTASSLAPNGVEVWPWDSPYKFGRSPSIFTVELTKTASPYFDKDIKLQSIQVSANRGSTVVKSITLSDGENIVRGLAPGTNYTLKLVATEQSGNTYPLQTSSFTTLSGPTLTTSQGPTSADLMATIKKEADRGERCWWEINGESYQGESVQAISLAPNTYYNAIYKVEYEGLTYSFNKSFTTQSLSFKTLNPKGVSSTCSIVAAETNISADEPRVGFQWKKYDAPATLAPSEGYAAVCDGVLEGYIKNLQPAFYYNVRPFYKDGDDNYYYGDWVTFDPSDFSYFEPTVRTYPVQTVTTYSATVRGYALSGTDNIKRQGFQYWKSGSQSAFGMQTMADDAVYTVDATGQVMTVTLDNLESGCTYTYRAFVQTDAGYTYGEEQSFTTIGLSAISTVEADEEVSIVGYYDMMGRRFDEPQPGFNIIVNSNGTTKKIFWRQ